MNIVLIEKFSFPLEGRR